MTVAATPSTQQKYMLGNAAGYWVAAEFFTSPVLSSNACYVSRYTSWVSDDDGGQDVSFITTMPSGRGMQWYSYETDSSRTGTFTITTEMEILDGTGAVVSNGHTTSWTLIVEACAMTVSLISDWATTDFTVTQTYSIPLFTLNDSTCGSISYTCQVTSWSAGLANDDFCSVSSSAVTASLTNTGSSLDYSLTIHSAGQTWAYQG